MLADQVALVQVVTALEVLALLVKMLMVSQELMVVSDLWYHLV